MSSLSDPLDHSNVVHYVRIKKIGTEVPSLCTELWLEKFYVLFDANGFSTTHVADLPLVKVPLNQKVTQDVMRIFEARGLSDLEGKVFDDATPFEPANKSFEKFLSLAEKVWFLDVAHTEPTSYTVTLGFNPDKAKVKRSLLTMLAELFVLPIMGIMTLLGFKQVSTVSMSTSRVRDFLRITNLQNAEDLKGICFSVSQSRLFKSPEEAIRSVY